MLRKNREKTRGNFRTHCCQIRIFALEIRKLHIICSIMSVIAVKKKVTSLLMLVSESNASKYM